MLGALCAPFAAQGRSYRIAGAWLGRAEKWCQLPESAAWRAEARILRLLRSTP